MKRLMVLILMLGLSSRALAQEPAPATQPGVGHEAQHASGSTATDDTHPRLSENGTWAGSMVIVVIASFVCAAVVGVVVRLNMPETPPEPAHHDDHGHDHGTGHGGGHGHDDHSKGGHGH